MAGSPGGGAKETRAAIVQSANDERCALWVFCFGGSCGGIYWSRSQSQSYVTSTDSSPRSSTLGRGVLQERIEYLEKKIQTKDEVLAELIAEDVARKNAWGTLTGVWVPQDTRDQIVDFVRRWSENTQIGAGRFIGWLNITASKFYDWRERYGKVNEHNGWVPRDF